MSHFEPTKYSAAILDLDGVITRTMLVHIKAWKIMLDEYLLKKSIKDDIDYELIDLAIDYPNYIDGIPRNEGVANFLASRNIFIEEGEVDDEPGKETICGLGNRKFECFKHIIEEEGIVVYYDNVNVIKDWKRQGIRMGVISLSHSSEFVLQITGLIDLFDVVIDGKDMWKLRLKGKPAPDTFLEITTQLGCVPEATIVVDDSLMGVTAAKRGNFGCIIGIDRQNKGDIMKIFGANFVTPSLELING